MKVERRPITGVADWLAWRREDVVTASRIAALFGLHPRETPFSLYQRAQGMEAPENNDPKSRQRGLAMEKTVAGFFQVEHPELKVKKANVYLRDSVRKISATPDYFLRAPNGQRGVLECKTVAPQVFKKYWTPELPPTWIQLQTLTQAMLAQATFGWIAALVVDGYHFDLHCYEVPRHGAAERRILQAVEDFWRHVEIGRPPEPDYSSDGDLIAAMNPHTTPGKIVDLRHDNHLPDLLDERARLKQEIEDAKGRCEEIENEIKAKVGDAEAAMVAGWRVTLKEIHKKEHHVKATSYRQLRAVRDESNPERAETAAHEAQDSGAAA